MNNNMNWLVVIFLAYALHVAESFKCNGEHEYIAADGSCRQCEMCPAGFEPTPYHCGYGEKTPLYSCKPCDYESYSLSMDYNLCRTCNPCQRWNALTSSQCTSTSNSECGKCHPGYFRPQKADGRSDIECHKCNGASDPNCLTTNWILVVVVLSIVSGIAIIIATVFVCLFRRSRKKREISKLKAKPTEPFPIVPCRTSSVSTSCEMLSPSPSTQVKSIRQIPSTDLLIELDTDTYSNRPTAQFQQSTLYPNLPTAQFNTHQSVGTRTAGTSCFGSVDQLRRDIDTFDTNSINHAAQSLQQEHLLC